MNQIARMLNRRRQAALKYYHNSTQEDYSDEYDAILDAVTSSDYPDSDLRAADNTFIEELKTAGIWSKGVIRYVLQTNGASSFSRVNWQNPAQNNLLEVGSPIFTTGVGYKSAGNDSYLRTQWTKGLTINNNISVSWKTTQNTSQSTQQPFGARSSSGVRIQCVQWTAGNTVTGSLASGAIVLDDGPVSNGSDFMTMTGDGTNVRFYRNGVLIKTIAIASNANVTHEMYLLAQNNGGTADGEFTSWNLKYFGVSQWLDDDEVLALYNAWSNRELFFLVDPV